MVPDIGSPLTVVGVDLMAENFFPTYAEYADYIMTAGGYLAAFMGWGGDYVKNIGIASAPLTARKIYDRIKAGTMTSRVTTRRATVSRSYQPEFKSAGARAF